MTVNEMYTNYERYSSADSYIVGFMYQHCVYMVEMETMPLEILTVEKASRNQGENLRMRIKKDYKKSILQNSTKICDEEIFTKIVDNSKYNKGEIFEKIVTEYFGGEWTKDNIPFWKQGDICVNGKQIQIKFDAATLLNTKQIARLASMN